MTRVEELEGVKILKAYTTPYLNEEGEAYDNTYLVLETDKGIFEIIPAFGSYTGKSVGEYPTYNIIKKSDL